jgi:hypothetical protein
VGHLHDLSENDGPRGQLLVVEALDAHDLLLVAVVGRLLAFLRRPLLRGLGSSRLVLGAHVAEAIVAAALGAGARLLEQHVLVRLDLDLLVLEGRQNAGAASREGLLLLLEDTRLRRRGLLGFCGRWLRRRGLLCDIGLASLRGSVGQGALVPLGRGAGLLGLSFYCAHGGWFVCIALRWPSANGMVELFGRQDFEKKSGSWESAMLAPTSSSKRASTTTLRDKKARPRKEGQCASPTSARLLFLPSVPCLRSSSPIAVFFDFRSAVPVYTHT